MFTKNNHPFLKALSEGPLIADGAMGTQLYERGVYINRSLEEINLTNPNLVRQIHREYIDAGAELIKTHTFAASRLKLIKHGLDNKLKEINTKAVQIAKEASGGKIFIAGSMGPAGISPPFDYRQINEIKDSYREQATLLAGGGVDLFIIESFRFLQEIVLALEAVKEFNSIPVIALMAFENDEKTGDGATPLRVFETLKSGGANIIGANCFGGPKHIYNIIEKMVGNGIPVAALPGVGMPGREDDRMIYPDTPEYFGVYAKRFLKKGVSLLGGCCGTGPEHIRFISNSASMMKTGRIRIISPGPEEKKSDILSAPKNTQLAKKIFRVYKDRVCAKKPLPVSPENFVVSVEVNPPRGLDLTSTLETAKMLRDGGADVINIADGPRATVRMSNQAMGHIVQDTLNMEIILHVCCRDRNLLGLQADLLANHVLGIRNLVIITGDPPKLGDYPHATAVFDLDSINLLRLVNNLNCGLDPSGKTMDRRTEFFCATGAEPAALNYDRELKRLVRKKEAGAQFIMTQPVYDIKIVERFLNDIKYLDMPVLLGLLPLASYRNALFLHREVPGIHIPEDILSRMEGAGKGPKAREEGIKIAQDMLLSVLDRVVGAYIMPPLGYYSSALKILECAGYFAENHLK